MHEYGGDPAVPKLTDWEHNPTIEVTRSRLAERLNEQTQWPRKSVVLAIELLSERKVIGTIGLRIAEERTARDFGYAMNCRYWNQGYATEAARAIIDVAFRRLNLHRVWATCDTRNVGSYRVLEKIGMRREAHFIKDAFQKGEWRDSYLYAILAEEWV